MKALRNLTPEKRNASVFLLIFLFGTIVTILFLRLQTPVTKIWEQTHGEKGQWHEIAFSPDGEFLITAAETVKVWRAKDGQLVKSFPLNIPNLYEINLINPIIAPNGKWFVTYNLAGTVKVWKLTEGKVARWFKVDGGWPFCGAFSPDGEFLAAASYELGVVKVWRVESGELVKSLSLGDRIVSLAVSPGGEFLAVMLSSNPNRLELWHLPTVKKISTVKVPIIPEWLSFSSDSKFLIATGLDFVIKGYVRGYGKYHKYGKYYTVALWKVNSERLHWEIASLNFGMVAKIHPCDNSLLFVHEYTSHDLLAPLLPAFRVYGDVLSCWRLTKGGLKKLWEVLVSKSLTSVPTDPFPPLAFSPDGKLMAVVTVGSRVKVFRLNVTSKGGN